MLLCIILIHDLTVITSDNAPWCCKVVLQRWIHTAGKNCLAAVPCNTLRAVVAMHINWHDLNAAWYPLTRRFNHKDDGEDESTATLTTITTRQKSTTACDSTWERDIPGNCHVQPQRCDVGCTACDSSPGLFDDDYGAGLFGKLWHLSSGEYHSCVPLLVHHLSLPMCLCLRLNSVVVSRAHCS